MHLLSHEQRDNQVTRWSPNKNPHSISSITDYLHTIHAILLAHRACPLVSSRLFLLVCASSVVL
jgi:hypothetical protein